MSGRLPAWPTVSAAKSAATQATVAIRIQLGCMALSMGQLIDQLLHVRPKEGPLLVLFSKLAFAHERSRHQCGKSVVTDTRGAGHSLGRAPLTEVHQKTCCTEAAVVTFTLDYEFVPRMLSCDALRRLEPAEHASATPIERV